MENSRGIGAVRPGSRGARSCWTFLRDALLVSLLAGCCAGQCDSCLEYCCEGAPPFCCSYYAYVGDVLSEWIPQFFHEEAGEGWMFDYYSAGTAISGIVFGVVFLMGAVAAIFLCLCMCVKNGRNSRVGVFRACHVNTVAQGYRGPPPPYSYDYEMNPHHILPPPYTPTPPRTHPPPPPYPGYSSK